MLRHYRTVPAWGERTSRPTATGLGPVVAVLLGVSTILIVVAAIVLPYAAHLTRPDLLVVAGGMTVLGCGLVLVRERAVGPVGWLVLGAGVTWFLPALAVTGLRDVDLAIRCTTLLHLALLAHGVVVVGSPRVRGGTELVGAMSGYAAALTAVVGGYRLALPLVGAVLAVTVLLTGRRRRPTVRSWRRVAGLVLGVGLVVDALLRLWSGIGAESWVAVAHPAEVAVTALLVAVAGTRLSTWQSIEVRLDGADTLTAVVAEQLGDPDASLALSDGDGGWLRPTGEPRAAPTFVAWTVTEGDGRVVAVIEGQLTAPVPTAVDNVLRLAGVNARLRRSLVLHVEQLEHSGRRLLSAADSERAALGAQLRARAISAVAATERELRRLPL